MKRETISLNSQAVKRIICNADEAWKIVSKPPSQISYVKLRLVMKDLREDIHKTLKIK